MTSRLVTSLVLAGALLAFPAVTHAQEAVLTGNVTDSTGSVLPGALVRAVHQASGNTFETVTDERGAYRIPVRSGGYVITAQLAGFVTVTRRGVELLVGQTAAINLQMAVGAAEAITVTAETPLVNTVTSNLGGNVDMRQLSELPVAQRNWINLALVAPGSRTSPTNAVAPLPDRHGGDTREFQLNVDGQQVSSELGAGNQPKYSADAIQEFQFISNRFDATLGRSTGVQVNAVTKSGTNKFTGLFRTNFQSTSFNAPDPVAGKVLPISDQQYSTAVGGPLVQNKLHYFVNYENEQHPLTSAWTTKYAAFNAELSGKETRNIGGVRVDYQLSQKMRLMGKASGQHTFTPFGAGSSSTAAASTVDNDEKNSDYVGQLTTVISNRAVNEFRTGFSHYGFATHTLVNWANHWQASNGITNGYPRITFTGFALNANANAPRHRDQEVWQVRDDLSYSLEARGRHDLKLGVEYVRHFEDSLNCAQCGGTIDARGTANGLSIPTPEMINAWFPNQFDASTWNLAALSPWVRNYTIGIGNFPNQYAQPKVAGWVQDDWRPSSRLTLNLGVRYDLFLNQWANDLGFGPSDRPELYFPANRPNDRNTIQPRLGFAYELNDRTVIRGGSGLFYSSSLTVDAFWPKYNTQIARIQITNDGRTNFAADPLKGATLPTFDQALKLFCDAPEQAATFAAWAARGYSGAAPCLLNSLQEEPGPADIMRMPRSWNTSIGIQRQFGNTMALQVDYVQTQGSHEKDVLDNANLAYNPATGANYAFTNANRGLLPWPSAGVVSMIDYNSTSSLRALQSAFTKRMSNHWQASATYTLSWFYDEESQPVSGRTLVPFPVADDLGGPGSYGLAATDQRHRAVFTGIWEVSHGFQVSALHYLGAGIRSATMYGGDVRLTGGTFSARLRPDGTVVPRNSYIQPAQNRTDIRVQQRIKLQGRMAIDGIAEVFNVFNQTNYTIDTAESSATYLAPVTGQNRTAQIGFRLSF
ncbi:MAG TPA: TonB-dependent receptor [Planctomycetota bacterium]|nr:TonB-dependent receptor [Planctomycetota bacterium]